MSQGEGIYEASPGAVSMRDSLSLHGGAGAAQVDNLITDYIEGDLTDDDFYEHYGPRGLDKDSLVRMKEDVWSGARSRAEQELSREDAQFLATMAESNPQIRKLTMMHGWKVETGQATMSWPEFAAAMRRRVSRA